MIIQFIEFEGNPLDAGVNSGVVPFIEFEGSPLDTGAVVSGVVQFIEFGGSPLDTGVAVSVVGTGEDLLFGLRGAPVPVRLGVVSGFVPFIELRGNPLDEGAKLVVPALGTDENSLFGLRGAPVAVRPGVVSTGVVPFIELEGNPLDPGAGVVVALNGAVVAGEGNSVTVVVVVVVLLVPVRVIVSVLDIASVRVLDPEGPVIVVVVRLQPLLTEIGVVEGVSEVLPVPGNVLFAGYEIGKELGPGGPLAIEVVNGVVILGNEVVGLTNVGIPLPEGKIGIGELEFVNGEEGLGLAKVATPVADGDGELGGDWETGKYTTSVAVIVLTPFVMVVTVVAPVKYSTV